MPTERRAFRLQKGFQIDPDARVDRKGTGNAALRVNVKIVSANAQNDPGARSEGKGNGEQVALNEDANSVATDTSSPMPAPTVDEDGEDANSEVKGKGKQVEPSQDSEPVAAVA
ncbi:MAG: hypothetical protein M1831_003353 [Alyxoria varia]|nr:MAG: hypothetical protein M1831_003353 [Alyxoria varia]